MENESDYFNGCNVLWIFLYHDVIGWSCYSFVGETRNFSVNIHQQVVVFTKPVFYPPYNECEY